MATIASTRVPRRGRKKEEDWGRGGGGKTERKRTKRNDIIRLVATALMIINGRGTACIRGDRKDKADG